MKVLFSLSKALGYREGDICGQVSEQAFGKKHFGNEKALLESPFDCTQSWVLCNKKPVKQFCSLGQESFRFGQHRRAN